MEPKKKRGIIRRLRDKYRLVVYNDNTFEEVLQFRLSRLNLFSLIGSAILFLIILVIVLIAFTPIREFIPGYPDGMIRRNIVMNAIKLDSLQEEIEIKNKYLENINTIISGNIPKSVDIQESEKTGESKVQFKRSKSDSLLRRHIEEEEQFNLSITEVKNEQKGLSNIHFFTPLNGIVTNSFNLEEDHFGTDIVARSSEVVKATLDGIVSMATWTIETGNVIQIQHDNNIVSVYKHNANLLKEVGDHVEAGEAIAIVGNSGELTTGPHLHFELWYNGRPIDPEDYIIF